MATKTLPSLTHHHKSLGIPRRLESCRRTSHKALSIVWPFKKQTKMFQTESSSMPKLNLIRQKEDESPKSVPTSPVQCLREPVFIPSDSYPLSAKVPPVESSTEEVTDDSCYFSSSCSSGYSSGYSSGDSATIESDLNSAIAQVSTTEVGSTGMKLQPVVNKFLSKKRNSKEKLTSSNSFPYIDIDEFHSCSDSSCNQQQSQNSSELTADLLSGITTMTLNSDTTTDSNSLPMSSEDFTSSTELQKSSKRPSKTSISSNSSDISIEGSPRRRVRDDEGFIRRAACVCVNEDESKVVLISSKNSGGGWLVPGGGLEAGEEETAAAVREAWEEAGITGSIKRRLGIFEIEDDETHKRKRTAVYVLKVLEQHNTFPEAILGRTRQWYSIDSAISHLAQCKPHQIAYLRAL